MAIAHLSGPGDLWFYPLGFPVEIMRSLKCSFIFDLLLFARDWAKSDKWPTFPLRVAYFGQYLGGALAVFDPSCPKSIS